jgi:hypothetical protein
MVTATTADGILTFRRSPLPWRVASEASDGHDFPSGWHLKHRMVAASPAEDNSRTVNQFTGTVIAQILSPGERTQVRASVKHKLD